MKIILMMAMTVDGIVAKNSFHNADWTSKADKIAFIAETKKHGAIIMGQNTFIAIGRPLPNRLNFILSLEPEKYKEKEIPGVLEFFKGSPQEVISALKKRNFQTAILGGGPYTNASFLKAGLVDEMLITVEPRLFGNGMTFAKGEDLDIKLEFINATPLGDSALQIRYKIIK